MTGTWDGTETRTWDGTWDGTGTGTWGVKVLYRIESIVSDWKYCDQDIGWDWDMGLELGQAPAISI